MIVELLIVVLKLMPSRKLLFGALQAGKHQTLRCHFEVGTRCRRHVFRCVIMATWRLNTGEEHSTAQHIKNIPVDLKMQKTPRSGTWARQQQSWERALKWSRFWILLVVTPPPVPFFFTYMLLHLPSLSPSLLWYYFHCPKGSSLLQAVKYERGAPHQKSFS